MQLPSHPKAFALAAIMALPMTAGAGQPTLCAGDEQVLFNCATTELDVLSVCASKVLTADQGVLQLRVGTPGAGLAAKYPAVPSRPTEMFTASRGFAYGYAPPRLEIGLNFSFEGHEATLLSSVASHYREPPGEVVPAEAELVGGPDLHRTCRTGAITNRLDRLTPLLPVGEQR